MRSKSVRNKLLSNCGFLVGDGRGFSSSCLRVRMQFQLNVFLFGHPSSKRQIFALYLDWDSFFKFRVISAMKNISLKVSPRHTSQGRYLWEHGRSWPSFSHSLIPSLPPINATRCFSCLIPVSYGIHHLCQYLVARFSCRCLADLWVSFNICTACQKAIGKLKAVGREEGWV